MATNSQPLQSAVLSCVTVTAEGAVPMDLLLWHIIACNRTCVIQTFIGAVNRCAERRLFLTCRLISQEETPRGEQYLLQAQIKPCKS